MNFLVIEDHPLVSSSLAKVLEDWQDGVRVTLASSMDSISDDAPAQFAAILLDLDLGGGIEFDTMQTLKSTYPEAPVIIFSGSTNPMVIKRSRAFGSSAFIRKGESVARMLEIIDLVVLGGNAVFPDNLVPPVTTEDPQREIARRLTRREGEVYFQLCKGGTNKEIAQFLDIEEKTVRAHLTEIYRKLGVKNRTEAILL